MQSSGFGKFSSFRKHTGKHNCWVSALVVVAGPRNWATRISLSNPRSEDFSFKKSKLIFIPSMFSIQACSPFDRGGWSCSYTRFFLAFLCFSSLKSDLRLSQKRTWFMEAFLDARTFETIAKRGNIFSLWLHCLAIKLHQLTPCFCKLSLKNMQNNWKINGFWT